MPRRCNHMSHLFKCSHEIGTHFQKPPSRKVCCQTEVQSFFNFTVPTTGLGGYWPGSTLLIFKHLCNVLDQNVDRQQPVNQTKPANNSEERYQQANQLLLMISHGMVISSEQGLVGSVLYI